MADETIPTRDPRTSVMLFAHVFRAHVSAPSEHRVVNISASGVCITKPAGIAADTAVAVTIGEVDLAPADIVWVRGGLAGLRFRAPIDLAAARRRRTEAVAPPAAGWLAELNDAYRQ